MILISSYKFKPKYKWERNHHDTESQLSFLISLAANDKTNPTSNYVTASLSAAANKLKLTTVLAS